MLHYDRRQPEHAGFVVNAPPPRAPNSNAHVGTDRQSERKMVPWPAGAMPNSIGDKMFIVDEMGFLMSQQDTLDTTVSKRPQQPSHKTRITCCHCSALDIQVCTGAHNSPRPWTSEPHSANVIRGTRNTQQSGHNRRADSSEQTRNSKDNR